VIPNGIAEHFHRAPSPEQVEGPVRLAFIGRWTTYKGTHTLLEAAGELERRGIAFSLSLLGTAGDAESVVASFPESLRARVSVTPAFPNAGLPELLKGAEIFLFPSLSEGSSASLIEAMACGLAPVATSVGAAPEIVDGNNGVLVEPGDARAMADAVEGIARDRVRLLELRRRAQDRARHYRWAEVADRTLAVYRTTLGAART
jgi:glycosyltransferase involved in cell wall biosynthesis